MVTCLRAVTQIGSTGPRTILLKSVAATSATNAWAVGVQDDCPEFDCDKPLVLHWNGDRWRRQSIPDLHHNVVDLTDVTALDSSHAWATDFASGLIYAWDGTSWKVQATVPAFRGGLYGMTALSATNVWAVGTYGYTHHRKTLVMHFDGTTWRQVASPNRLNSINILSDVTAISAKNIWAVGNSSEKTLIEHYDGTRWRILPSPNVGTYPNELNGITRTSKSTMVAVGFRETSQRGTAELSRTLILHCC